LGDEGAFYEEGFLLDEVVFRSEVTHVGEELGARNVYERVADPRYVNMRRWG
jgi:hypothetical protein